MNTKLLMTASAIILGIIGLSLSFIPIEITEYLNLDTNIISTLSFQLLGALYLGFSMMNWMAKGSIIGGIYNRPIAIGNFMHFGVGAFALVKLVSSIEMHQEIFISLTVIYAIFALSFAYVFRTNPGK
ncbi:MAG: hypothetical protein IZT56_11615 [Bacteroidetes bacterium]|nr:hypothetical protein [Bacteroidota bacterium]